MDDITVWLESVLTSSSETCRHLVTLNPEYVMLARRDGEFREVLRQADLATADGIGIVLAARWLYPGKARAHPLRRITGVDLVEKLAGTGEARLFLLGGAPGIASRAAVRLTSQNPGFMPAGLWAGGSPEVRDDPESLARIRESGAGVVLVAYGAPGQIHWIARNQDALASLGVRLAIGVGGAFDYLAGAIPRAPGWMRRAGLEWLYRLVRQPWRWRRQRVLPLFALRVLGSGIARRLSRRA